MSDTFYQSYLYAYMFWVGLTLGCVALLLLHHMIRSTWGLPIQRLLEAGTRTLPLMLILFIPIAAAILTGHLYPWVDPKLADDDVIRHRHPFNNPGFFIVRTIVYFGFWIVVTTLLNRSVDRQERTGDLREAQYRSNLAAPMLVFHILILTVAITDWVMSLDTRWFSTIYGIWFMIGHGLNAISFCILILTWHRLQNRPPYAEIVTKPLMRDLGNVMLALTMFWGYFSLSQILIIWSGNLPDETRYYATRMSMPWNWLGALVVYGQFFVAFLALLYNGTKRNAQGLFATAALVFVMRILDVYWAVVPFFPNASTPGTLLLPCAVLWLVMGAIWLVVFYGVWKSRAPLPTYDTRLQVQEAHSHA